MLSDETLLGALSEHGVQKPDMRLTWEAVVTVAPRENLGTTPLGQRFIIPITGGLFRGGAEHPDLKGIVLPRGADRQLLRADGVKQLSATYEMQVEDGTVLGIENEVVMDTEAQPKRYAASRIHVLAPEGRWAWMNRRLFVGTLQSDQPNRGFVVIRGWEILV
ncbi:Protein of unknown function [Cohaesibacter marisflavi]|uniref:Uncharacterized protein n=1 Tax=Cohaesibacter marisflavi TaxID=655353 RepID=A0A1I5LTW4_9HYPH|nr:DUF3237 family protein [Cohaesibacter marisflavi]SFP00603.1 Protein of unknown function [Cohaesibacter marisflavi]